MDAKASVLPAFGSRLRVLARGGPVPCLATVWSSHHRFSSAWHARRTLTPRRSGLTLTSTALVGMHDVHTQIQECS